MTAANLESKMIQAATAMKKHKAVYWLVGEDYEQSRKEFEYIKDSLLQLNLLKTHNISMPVRGSWRLLAIDGAIEVVTKTAKDIRKLGRESPDGILVNEAAQVDFDVYLKCLGRTAPKRTFLFLSGTLESSTDWYSQKLKLWQGDNADGARAFILPSWANLSIYPYCA